MSVTARIKTGALAIALALAAFGCDGQQADGLPRHAVEGTVTWRGKPLEAGTIQFQPAAAGGQAVLEVTEIKAGAFTLDLARGLVPGDYKVVISSVPPPPPLPPGEAPGEAPKRPKEQIPTKYNQKSTLTTKVPPEGPGKLEFTLTD